MAPSASQPKAFRAAEPSERDIANFSQSTFHVMTKPIGPICNLDCAYCYYLHKEDLYPGETSWRMAVETLETYIRQYVDAQPSGTREFTFAWQGGEPTLLGLEFFERVVKIQLATVPPGARIENSVQTNGVLLDDDWCQFFRRNGFLIGLSIDGPPDVHDGYRVDRNGSATHSAVRTGMRLLQKHGVEFNALVVVHRQNQSHGARVYRYLRDSGVRFLQFIPLVERRGTGRHAEPVDQTSQPAASPRLDDHDVIAGLVSSRSVEPGAFGEFLMEVFDVWAAADAGRVFVQIFDQTLAACLDVEPSLCVFKRECGRALAMEHNGDVYCCDHFVEPDYLLGNVRDTSLKKLANSTQMVQFGQYKDRSLPAYCRACEVRFICNGECPKNRFLATPDGEQGLNYLCAGYRAFFNHIMPTMKKMAVAVKSGKPAASVLQQASAGPPKSSRNLPCPCGSGRQFKTCCGR